MVQKESLIGGSKNNWGLNSPPNPNNSPLVTLNYYGIYGRRS